MYDAMREHGFLLANGEIDKEKINALSGTITVPFVREVWATTNHDVETVGRMQEVLTGFYNSGRNSEFLDVLQLLYGMVGLEFPAEIEYLMEHPAASSYFLFEFLADLDEEVSNNVN